MAKKPTAKTAKEAPTAAPTEDLDVAGKIWLAGVGAYGRIFSEAQGQVGKVTGTANEMFEQLVATGEQVEHVVRARLSSTDAAQKVADAVGKMQALRAERRADLEARVAQVRKAVTEAVAPYNPLTLAKTVEQLAEDVKALRAEVAALKAPKPTARKAARPVAQSAPARRKRA